MGPESSCDMIFWERSYWFSLPFFAWHRPQLYPYYSNVIQPMKILLFIELKNIYQIKLLWLIPTKYNYFDWHIPQLYPYCSNVLQLMRILHESYFLSLKNTIVGSSCFFVDMEYMGLKLSFHCMWVPRARAIWFSKKGVIGSHRPGNLFLGFCFLI